MARRTCSQWWVKARIKYIDDVNAYYGASPEEPENPWEDYTTGGLPLSLD